MAAKRRKKARANPLRDCKGKWHRDSGQFARCHKAAKHCRRWTGTRKRSCGPAKSRGRARSMTRSSSSSSSSSYARRRQDFIDYMTSLFSPPRRSVGGGGGSSRQLGSGERGLARVDQLDYMRGLFGRGE